MIVLGIETATSVCSVGLVDDQRLLAEKSEDAGRRHSIVLLDMIEAALTEVGLTRDRLEGVAVSAGPGAVRGRATALAAPGPGPEPNKNRIRIKG